MPTNGNSFKIESISLTDLCCAYVCGSAKSAIKQSCYKKESQDVSHFFLVMDVGGFVEPRKSSFLSFMS